MIAHHGGLDRVDAFLEVDVDTDRRRDVAALRLLVWFARNLEAVDEQKEASSS